MADKQVDIVVVGSMFVDFFSYANQLPKPGETLIGTDFQVGFGGKGANQCVAAQRLGSKTAFIGKVGKDSHGQGYLNHLEKEGVNVDGIEVDDKLTTGVTSIIVGTDRGENMIVAVPGATWQVNAAYVRSSALISFLETAKILICQLEIPVDGAVEALNAAKSRGVRTVLNAAPVHLSLPVEIFALADILCLNEVEAEMITGLNNVNTEKGAKAAIAKLVADFLAKHVIITLGAEGALLWDADEQDYHVFQVPVFEKPVVDTTGAGDCFVGTLAHCLAQGESLVKATSNAVINASWSVLKTGTQTSYPLHIHL